MRRSFEYLESIISWDAFKAPLIIVYRPPYSMAHPITLSMFVSEFVDYPSFCRHAESLIIKADFNIHVDDRNNLDSVKFLDLLDSNGWAVYGPTTTC